MNKDSHSQFTERAQPKDHYDYDGLTGFWLWLPTGFHLFLTLLMWPIFMWLLPLIPFKKHLLHYYFVDHALILATAFSLFCALSMILGLIKARLVSPASRASRLTIPKIIHAFSQTKKNVHSGYTKITHKRDRTPQTLAKPIMPIASIKRNTIQNNAQTPRMPITKIPCEAKEAKTPKTSKTLKTPIATTATATAKKSTIIENTTTAKNPKVSKTTTVKTAKKSAPIKAAKPSKTPKAAKTTTTKITEKTDKSTTAKTSKATKTTSIKAAAKASAVSASKKTKAPAKTPPKKDNNA